MRLLIIEDEPKIAAVIKKALERASYAVDIVNDGVDGLAAAQAEDYDGLVIDRMLPGIGGVEIIRQLRSAGNKTPILMLTALGTVKDKASGLDAGADDYLVKPFALEELLARVRALLRRPATATPVVLEVGDLTVDSNSRSVERAGKPIELTTKEYALLEYLIRHPGQVISKEQLIAHVWDFDADILPNNVEAYIKQLRHKIDKPFGSKLIKTVRGFGYKVSG